MASPTIGRLIPQVVKAILQVAKASDKAVRILLAPVGSCIFSGLATPHHPLHPTTYEVPDERCGIVR